MNLLFDKRFVKDIEKLDDKKLKKQIEHIIEELQECQNIIEISRIKKMKGHPSAFRIRTGDYRIGLFVDQENVIIVRVLHRKDIYKKFP